MGLRQMAASGLPLKRVDSYRAGIMAAIFIYEIRMA
jgi:hypothetical protein